MLAILRKMVIFEMLKISIHYRIINMVHSVGQETTVIHLAKLFHIKVSSKSINYRALRQH